MGEYITAGDEINGWDSLLSDDVDLFSLEQLLMADDGDAAAVDQLPELPDDFFSDLILDSPAGSGEGEVVDYEKNSGSNSDSNSASAEEKSDDVVVEVEKKDQGEDGLSKKEKRQLRNRDAAVRSRERKKMYVKDLELKSRYLEGECRRLGMLLQCCSAENQALRLSLQNAKTYDASMSKQESAVLVMESLLLGSLLWFLGIMCLFNLPTNQLPQQENVGVKAQGSLVLVRKPLNRDELFGSKMSKLFIMSRRCKGSRSRMKFTTSSRGIFG